MGEVLVEVKELKKYFPVPKSLMAKLVAKAEDQLVRAVDG